MTKVGSYGGPGGAENAAIAPAGFGPASGDLLLTTDKARGEGRLIAIGPHGHVTTLATVHGDGLNSLAVLPSSSWKSSPAGVVIADTRSEIAWFVPAKQLRRFAGDVLVAAERRGSIYIVEPNTRGYRTIVFKTGLTGGSYNLEGATIIP